MADFEKMMSMFPFNWKQLMAQGVTFLSDELDAEEVKMRRHPNGVSIAIVTDEENIEKAMDFWETEVEPVLQEGD